MEKSTHFTLLYLIVVGGYIAFFQIFHPQNHFTMTLPPILPKCEIRTYPHILLSNFITFCYFIIILQSPPSPPY